MLQSLRIPASEHLTENIVSDSIFIFIGDLQELKGCWTDEVKMTKGFDLAGPFIIHTVETKYRGFYLGG